MRPRLLDLFCGAGGATKGYQLAGFHVTGVDIRPQPHYCGDSFSRADAMTFDLDGFDAIHASPPCQAYTRARHLRKAQGGETQAPDLLAPIRERLAEHGVPYAIENVPGAPMTGVVLCGSMFGLRVRRHRIFEATVPIIAPACRHKEQGKPVGVYHVMGDKIPCGGHTAKTLEEAQAAMGIDWMAWKELKESIPPAYTELVGAALMREVCEGEKKSPPRTCRSGPQAFGPKPS